MTISTFIEAVPVYENAHGRHTDIKPNNHVAEKDPTRNKIVVFPPGWFAHDIQVGWIEAQCRGRQPICDQIHPKELHWCQALGNSQGSSEENGRHFTNIR